MSSSSSDDARIATFPSAFRSQSSRKSQCMPSPPSSLTSIFPGASSYPVVSPRAATHRTEKGEHHHAAKKSSAPKSSKQEREHVSFVNVDSSSDEEDQHQTIHIHESDSAEASSSLHSSDLEAKSSDSENDGSSSQMHSAGGDSDLNVISFSDNDGVDKGSSSMKIPIKMSDMADQDESSTKEKRQARRYFQEEDSSVRLRKGDFDVLPLFMKLTIAQMPKPCFLCGIKGHNARDCENQHAGSPVIECQIAGFLHTETTRASGEQLDLIGASNGERRCGSIQHSPYDCPDAIRFDGIIKMPPRSQRVDPLLSTAWSGMPQELIGDAACGPIPFLAGIRGNKDFWGIVGKLQRKLGCKGEQAVKPTKVRVNEAAGMKRKRDMDASLPKSVR
eukprot:755441-Hanusia_phi.AAC.5